MQPGPNTILVIVTERSKNTEVVVVRIESFGLGIPYQEMSIWQLPVESSGHLIPLCGLARCRRKNGSIVTFCDVYIGRRQSQGGWQLPESKWHNPFTIKTEGTAEAVCAKYYHYIKASPLFFQIEELRGRVLGCWCDPVEDTSRDLYERLNHPKCHGEVLMRLLAEASIAST